VNNRRAEVAERKARVAAIQAEQRRKERRRTILVVSIVGLVIAALVATTLAIVIQENQRNAEQEQALEDAVQSDIDGVQTFEGLGNQHVETAVEYEQNPPVGGDHSAQWQNCGVYTEPVQDVNAVHSLEHGAVWITYDPSLPADQVELLDAQAANNNYVLVTPREDLPTPVVASAWGLQLQLEDASDDRLPVFVAKYVNGPQTLERGASCSGGVGTPE
jgi:Protein of unknown function (DUF3105)